MKIDGTPYRTIWPAADGLAVEVIDQTQLPHRFVVRRWIDLGDAADAIKTMVVRGAPLIGAAAAYGMALGLRADPSDRGLQLAYDTLVVTRPTAINLRWALDRVRAALAPVEAGSRAAAAWRLAAEICDEDVAINEAIGRNGLTAIREAAARKAKAGGKGPVNILTHCNAGWLATVDWGTAIAPIYMAHDAGVDVHVWVDETRPRNQGASLTAWELGRHGVPHHIVADNAGGHLMQHGLVDLCIVGTDRVTARGDVCAAEPDDRLDCFGRRQGDPDRAAQPARSHADRRPPCRRQRGRGRYCGPRQPRAQRRVRRDAGAAGHRAHHRAGDLCGEPGGPGRAFPGPSPASRLTRGLRTVTYRRLSSQVLARA